MQQFSDKDADGALQRIETLDKDGTPKGNLVSPPCIILVLDSDNDKDKDAALKML